MASGGAGGGAVRIWGCDPAAGPHRGLSRSGFSHGLFPRLRLPPAPSLATTPPPPSGAFWQRPLTGSGSSFGARRPERGREFQGGPQVRAAPILEAPSRQVTGRGSGAAAPGLHPVAGARGRVGFPRKSLILRLGFSALDPAVYPLGELFIERNSVITAGSPGFAFSCFNVPAWGLHANAFPGLESCRKRAR